jgi:hypothetical protein
MALQPFGPRPHAQFSNSIHSRLDSLDGGSVYRKAATYTQNNTNTIMPRVGLELTIPVLQRAKTVHALDRAATVINLILFFSLKIGWSIWRKSNSNINVFLTTNSSKPSEIESAVSAVWRLCRLTHALWLPLLHSESQRLICDQEAF